MNTYSVNEAAEIIGIKPRAVQHRCKRDNIRKKDNKYLITDEIISLWRTKEEETNAILNAKRNPNATQLDVEIESLKTEIETLKAELSQYKNNTKLDLKQAIEIITTEAARQGVMHKIFTNEEFEEIIGTIALSENQQEQITYLRNRISKQDEALISIAKQVEQRNYIEAMDKGYNKPK